MSISHILNVDRNLIIQLVRSRPHLALLDEEELKIIPQKQRNELAQSLEAFLTQGPLEISAFMNKHGVSRYSVDCLVRSCDGDVSEINGRLVSMAYEQELSTAIQERLGRSLRDAEPVKLSTHDFKGLPPVWLIEKHLHRLLEAPELVSQFFVSYGDNEIRCIPKQTIARKRDAVVSQLMSGEIPFLDLRAMVIDFNELYASLNDAILYFSTLLDVSLISDYAISKKWLSTTGDDALRSLARDGFVDCTTKLPVTVPPAVQDAIMESVIQYTMENYPSKASQIQQYVVDSSEYALNRDMLFDLAKAQAQSQWHTTKEMPDKDLKFQLSDIVAAIPPDQVALHAVAGDAALEPQLAEQFSDEVAILESQNESEFSALWIERVLTRVHIYNDGLDGIEDNKLQIQLTELLVTYLQKELLPDTLAKAQSQGLTSSKKTRKNIQKLEIALKADIKDLAGIQSAIQKFAKKQDIQVSDDTTFLRTKSTMVGDMVRRIQKPKTDGPLLFLTLVVVLFAKYHPGVVYATGKFAPKLLKQLKSKLSVEDYGRLETWKELAKAGTLGTSDKEAMRQMVEGN
jgi:hypothetical protein